MNEEYVDYETFKTAMQYITFQLKDETFDEYMHRQEVDLQWHWCCRIH